MGESVKTISISKRIISLFLILFILLGFTDVRAFAAGYGQYTIRISTDYTASLKNIKFDIYRAELASSNGNIEKYNNKYVFSVYSDSKGKCTFDKPGNNFVIKADISTLPRKTGIAEDVWTVFGADSDTLRTSVNKIRYINIDSSELKSGEVKVKLRGSDKKELFAPYTVDISDAEVTETTNAENGRTTFITTQKITVVANGVKATKVLTEENTETINPTVSLVDSEYDNPAAYTEAGSFFMIHYDEDDYTADMVKNIFRTFEEAKTFYDGYGFNEPISDTGKFYNVYLITEGGASATTKHVKKGSSYIKLLAKKSYSDKEWVYYRSVIAHELFHAIMYTYTRKYGISPEKWFRESFANFAGLVFIGKSTNTLKKYINVFQSNPELPLTNTFDSRVYGATMLPLTIYEDFGGMNTIKSILEQFPKIGKNASNPEMTAISNGLSKINKSFSRSRLLIRFALNNMFPSDYYELSGAEEWNNSARSSGIIKSDCTMRNLKQQFLTTRYYDIAPGSNGKNAYITVCDNNNKYSNLAFCCALMKNSNMIGADFSDTIKGFTTFRIKNFSDIKYKYASFGIINTSISKSQNVSLKISYA